MNQEGNGCRSGAKGGEEGVKPQRRDAREHPLLWKNARQECFPQPGEGLLWLQVGTGVWNRRKMIPRVPEIVSPRPRRTQLRRDREQHSSQPGQRWQDKLPPLPPHIFPGMGKARVLGSR